jgi:curved DNA-binding protein CbpA
MVPDRGEPSLYELLGVPPGASQLELTRAYRRRARQLHPDLAADHADDAHEAFAALAHAYRVLSDPARRASYDTDLREPGGPVPAPGTRIAVRVARSAGSVRPGRPPWRPLIVAGPTWVFPNRPEAGR